MTHNVYITYQGHDPNKDDLIDQEAQDCGGNEEGSGFLLSTGERDVGCVFSDESDAARFQKKMKKYDWVKNISDVESY